jgi:predicted Zn-dependent protease
MARPAAGRPGPAGPAPGRRRRTYLLWGGLLLAAAGAFAAFTVAQRRADRDDGIRLALDGRLPAAEPLLAAALARDPTDADAWRALALGRIAAGDLDGSEEPLDRWQALRPSEPEPHLARVDWAVRRGRIPDAIEAARAALALKPDAEKLREQLAYWLFLTGKTEEADAECRRCRAARDSPTLAHLEAEIAHRLGDMARAGRIADELLARDPAAADALTLRGAVYLDAGDPEKAIPLLRTAAGARGGAASRARHYLSLALARTGREDEARKVLAAEQQFQTASLWEKYGRPDNVGAMVAIAEALIATGKADEAVKLLDRALAHDPHCRAAHKLLADVYDARGQSAKAADHRRQAVE